MVTRRKFLIFGSAGLGLTALSLNQFILQQNENLFDAKFLKAYDQNLVAALAPIILPESYFRIDGFERQRLMAMRVDESISKLEVAQQEELREFFTLAALQPLSFYLFAMPKSHNEKDLKLFMNELRETWNHRIAGDKLVWAYKGLIDLFFLSFYSLESSHKYSGYRGPKAAL